MITPPDGWTVERAGDALLLCPPQGPEHALFRYTERLRPIQRAIDLVRATPVPPDFVEREVTAPRRLTTIEGEHAALVIRTGSRGDARVELLYGYVFLDDYYAALEAIVHADHARMRELAAELVVGDVHLLGRLRRRRVIYKRPEGWHGEVGVFDACWSSGDARIYVNPALPNTPGLVRATLAKLGDATLVERFMTKQGLDTEHYQLGDSHVFFLSDAEFLYSARVDGALEVGRAVVDSIEPVPQPQRAVDAVQFWAD